MLRKSLVLLLLLSGMALAQLAKDPALDSQGKIKVDVDSASCDGRIGSRFSFAFKEAVQTSHGYALSSDKYALKVGFVCMNRAIRQNDADDGISGVVSAVAYWETQDGQCSGSQYIIRHAILQVGADRIDEMAKELLADIDHRLSGGK